MHDDRHRRERDVDRPVDRLDPLDRGALAAGQHDHLVAGPQQPARQLARVAAVIGRAHDPLHGEADVVEVAVARDLDLLEVTEQRRPVVPRRVLRPLDDVVAVQRRDRDRQRVVDAQLLQNGGELGLDLAEAFLVPFDEVHLVHARDHVLDPELGREVRVTAGLLEHAVAGVDQHDGQVGGRRAGDHVARVADVARGVGDDERALRRGEEAVRDVDRDPLLALGAQAVGEAGEVDLGVGHLVGHQRLGVVEQATDQRRLAVIDAAGGGEAQQRGHQK